MLRNLFTGLLTLALMAALYTYRDRAYVFLMQAYGLALPCARPIPYAIGEIDSRFFVATTTLIADTNAAAAEWNRAASSTLFVYDPSHAILTVNLVYDTRQAVTDKLKTLGLSVSDDSSSYDAVKAKYATLSAQYQKDKGAFDAADAAFQAEKAAYEKEVQYWNARGGAPQSEYEKLNAEKASLQTQQATLQRQAEAVNTEADDVNALVDELNHLASILNADASAYNAAGAGQGSQFEEGVFASVPGHEEIAVYEFDSRARLIRVLEHELGHSLGMEHVDDPEAIMYALNQGTSEKPTTADLAELARACRK